MFQEINSGLEQFRFKMISSNDEYDNSRKIKCKMYGKKLFPEGVLKDFLNYTAYFYAYMINESLSTGA